MDNLVKVNAAAAATARSHYGSFAAPSSVQSPEKLTAPVASGQVSETNSTPPKPAVRRVQRLAQVPVNRQSIGQEDKPSLTFGIEKSATHNSFDRTSDIVEEIRRLHEHKQHHHQQQQQQQQQQKRQQQSPQPQLPEFVELSQDLQVAKRDYQQLPGSDMKNSMTLPLPAEPSAANNELPARAYPKQIFFIVVSEFCERFSYYGLRAVLILYLSGVLGFSDKNATVCFHLFASLCYITPILGAVLGDSIWGKFKTILYLSMVYLAGELVLTTSSVFWNHAGFSVAFTAIGLILIGVGTGGIKPCVGALGGDQFLEHEHKRRESFFSLFYATINMGSLLSMFVTPILRSKFQCVGRTDCFPYAFALPSGLMFLAIIFFAVAKQSYTLVPLPEQNVIVAFLQCIWLALKRKLTGYKLDPINVAQMNNCLAIDTSSSSSLSATSSSEDVSNKSLVSSHQNKTGGEQNGAAKETTQLSQTAKKTVSDQTPNHWLYLASDQFDRQSIEDFRSVLAVLLLAVPLPVYWCLYDQQGSLWTLQATRMNGRLFNSAFELQPDQMSVFNPLLMLSLIPIFEVIVYPGLARFNLLKRPIQRMTVGGLLAGLAFVLSALIEMSILQNQPAELPPLGRANLLLVNGIGECRLLEPEISYIHVPGNEAQLLAATLNKTSQLYPSIEPLASLPMELLSADANNTSYLNNYKLKFRLADKLASPTPGTPGSVSGCPFNPDQVQEFNFSPLSNQAVRLLYVEQGNGKVSFKMFNETLALPASGRARVRLLYESFGSLAQSEKRQFSLHRQTSATTDANLQVVANGTATPSLLQFKPASRTGQVYLSEHMDVPVPTSGDLFNLHTNDNLLGNPLNKEPFLLKPATRNLIVVQQKNSTSVEVKLELLQDNTYRISMLYQLAPYLVMSISEVMMSITGLQFSYSMAPDNMKSVLLALWSIVVAFGNLLTVVVEAMHFFPSVVHDFLFYATIMTVDMGLFAILGYYFKPYRSPLSTASSKL